MTRVRMEDHTDHDFSVSRTYLSTGSWTGEKNSFRESSFRSPHGIVEVYEMIGTRQSITSMRFIHNGRDYMRRWQTTWGDRTLARLAREFVDDIAGEPL